MKATDKPYEAVIVELESVLRAFFRTREGSFEAAAEDIASSLGSGGKILLFGNGGSAAQAQHFAAEMVNKLARERRALPALALTTDASCLTAIGNDTDFERVFSRQIEALGRKGDLAIALTTSGRSANVIEGLKAARAMGLVTVALTGGGEGAVAPPADHILDVPSRSTPRIQEAHLVILHLLAEALEARLAR
jgi:D-sedoheptulose 7-phosphate isomerase